MTESDQDHLLSAAQIRNKRQEYHGIYMHRTREYERFSVKMNNVF